MRLLSATCALGLALASCCPARPLLADDGGSGLTLCTTSAQCPAGDVCVDGLCSVPEACSGSNCPCGDGGPCPVGLSCAQGQCVPPTCQGVICPAGYTCVLGSCSCEGGACEETDAGAPDAGPPDAGPQDAGPTDAGSPDAGSLDAGPADAGTADAGAPDAGPPDAGTCYQCVTGASSCSLATAPAVGGSCPAGYSATAPACDPCWTCTNYGEGYCASTSDCGTWTANGTVSGTCFSCDGVPGVSTVSENDACYASQQNTLAVSATNGGWCPWPSGLFTATCGFDGNNSGIPFTAPVVDGGCASCSFTCGATCCLPATCVSSGNQCSVSDASQCCSNTLGPCFAGTGANCCQ